jgi:ATP-dependent Clp protease ATP-binding subunit ClpA
MPKKRESQPIQVWLQNFDRLRLFHAARISGRSQSDLARSAIVTMLADFEETQRDKQRTDQLLARLTPEAKEVVLLAEKEAKFIGLEIVGSEHLLLAAVADTREGANNPIPNFGLTHKRVLNKIESCVGQYPRTSSSENPPFTDGFLATIESARSVAKHLRDRRVDVEHLLLALMAQERGMAYDILELLGTDREAVRAALRKRRALRKEEEQKARRAKRRQR